MLRVTMDVFSGMPNPRWELAGRDHDELLSRVIDGNLNVLDRHSEVSLLGYRGFAIDAFGDAAERLAAADLPASFRISSVRAGADSLSGLTEGLLVERSAGAAPDDVSEHVLNRVSEISRGQSGLALPEDMPVLERRPSRSSTVAEDAGATEGGSFDLEMPEGRTPTEGLEVGGPDRSTLAAGCSIRVTSNHNFGFWNDNAHHRANNNCYNFASNWRTNTFAQPARGGTGRAFWETRALDVAGLRWGVAQDGWVTVGGCNRSSYEIALVIWPDRDFHFYRRVASANGNRRWAHKAGQTRARNTDDSGRLISSPFNCDRGNYTDWGGYRYHRSDRNRNIN